MSDDKCDNGCVLPLRFPRRPGQDLSGAHGDDCFCCEPDQRTSADNRPALAHFNYRIGSYGTIREWLFHQINQTPALMGWTHRAPDDPAVALLEGASILGDILSFYQETYANEAFLRTARWRESISDLVRLLGYRLSPAVGGSAVFAFELKKNEPVVIPADFRVKATLEGLAKPSEFETTQELTAYPWLSRFNLYRPLVESPFDAEFEIQLPEQHLSPLEVKVGDRLLIGEANTSWPAQPLHLTNAQTYIVDAIRELHGTKIFKVKGKLKIWPPNATVFAYRIGRTFRHLGYDSPAQIIDPSKPVTSTAKITSGTATTPAKTETSSTIPSIDVPFTRPINSAAAAFVNPAVSPALNTNDYPLNMEVLDLAAQMPIIMQFRVAYPGADELSEFTDVKSLIRTISKIEPVTMTWGGVSGSVSRITISDPVALSVDPADQAAASAAQAAADATNVVAATAATAAEAARIYAQDKSAAAASAATASLRADAYAAEQATKADAAANVAATMAVAYAVAASAKKDDATDAAAQEALRTANLALSAAEEAKRESDSDVSVAVSAVGSARTARDAAVGVSVSAGLVAAAHLGLDPLLDALAVGAGAAARVVEDSKRAADTAESSSRTAQQDSGTSVDKSREAQAAANAVALAAASDADATQRAADAKQAADDAKGAAALAVTDASDAKTAATIAAASAVTAANAAAAAAIAYDAATAIAAAAAQDAYIKKLLSETRMYIADALFHEVTSPMLKVIAARVESSDAKGYSLNFRGSADQVQSLKSRRIMLDKPGMDPELLTVVEVPTSFPPDTYHVSILRTVTLSKEIEYADFPNQNPITTVFGNLADADEGKTLPEVPIGSGDALKVFQNFKLPKAPLTYHIVPENTPVEAPEAEIYVDGRQWEKVDSFFGRGPKEKIYIIREDAAGNSWVQFGDGKSGARLSNGVNNVSAVFRIGAQAHGPLKEDTTVQAASKLKNLDRIQMPMVATGGAPPEDGENARSAAPGKVQSLGRMVSLKDFETEAAAIPGVARSAAAWQLVGNLPAVVVTVLMETGRSAEANAVRDTLNAYNRLRGAGRTAIAVDEGRRLYVTVSIQYALQPGFRAVLVEPEIRRALGVNFGLPAADEDQSGLFSLRRRRFGGPEYSSSIEGVVQNVNGVVWAKTCAFTALADTDDPESIALPSVSRLDPIVACDAAHLLSLYDKHLVLTAVAALGS